MTSSSDWQGRTALVIGCSGFLGRALTSRLRQSGAQVVGYSRQKPHVPGCEEGSTSGVTFVEGSVADCTLLEHTMRKFNVGTIFHLAAQANVNVGRLSPLETFDVNIRGTWNVLQAAIQSQQKVRVMLASTDVVYDGRDAHPHTEESSVDSSSPYAASKICAESIANCYHQSYGLPVCIARTCNVYGGGDTGFERIIPGTIRAVLRGEAPLIRSSGLLQREYLYIKDAIAGYMMLVAAMDDPSICGETFNFSSGTPVSVMTVVEAILKLLGRTDLRPKILRENSNEPASRHSSSNKATQKLGWRPETSLESGLEKAIAWYQEERSLSLTGAQCR